MGSIAVFCDSIRLPKVMWFVLHYWFGLSKNEIEDYFFEYSIKLYSKSFSMERIGKELSEGLKYKNVTVIPYRMYAEADYMSSIQILSSILEIFSIFSQNLRILVFKAYGRV